ncbi:MAG: cysteine--tRNA ligase, partial [Sphingopyxis sp.]|nr:cysteine--tRNA ligase [Sphingopyxis sp.]
AMSNDLNTPQALTVVERTFAAKQHDMWQRSDAVTDFGDVLGLKFFYDVAGLPRVRPKSATITEAEIEAALNRRKEARAAKDFTTSDTLRDDLTAAGVEVMDGDPLGWDWRLDN